MVRLLVRTCLYTGLIIGSSVIPEGKVFVVGARTNILTLAKTERASFILEKPLFGCRGGYTSKLLESDDEEEEESDDETAGEYFDEGSEDEESDLESNSASDSKLLSSTMKSMTKSQAKKLATAKEAINTGLAESQSAKQPARSRELQFQLPYILRACLNPVTLFAMTKAYFMSLFDLQYGQKDQTQTLRSALEEKAKKSGGSGGARGKRKMKTGQAKTLSDLPQLNT